MKFKFIILIFCLSVTPLFAQTVYHVNATTGDNTSDGILWSTALASLQAALEKAEPGDEIWVAEGTYIPTKSISQNEEYSLLSQYKSFILPKGVKLYGGFSSRADDNTGMSQRNWEAFPTILSGDFNEDDDEDFSNTNENALHVLIMIEADEHTVVDGFTITGGNANISNTVSINNAPVYNSCGGGIYAATSIVDGSLITAPTLNNLLIQYNSASYNGAGIYNNANLGEASLSVSNTIINNNKAGRDGGGIYNAGITKATPVLTNVIISGNEAGKSGGGLYCESERNITAPVLTNVLIAGNKANDAGGMVCYSYDNVAPILTNVTIVGNKAMFEGGGLACHASDGRNGISSPEIYNTVIWGNKSTDYPNIYNYGFTGSAPSIHYSFVEEPHTVIAGNLEGKVIPEFVSAIDADFAPTTEGNYQLNRYSPLINRGNNNFISLDTDLGGNTRIFDGTVDIGAYEYQETGGGSTNNEYIYIENNRVWTHAGNLYINIKEEPTTIRIYTVDGTLFHQVNYATEGDKVITLPPGIYFVSLNDKPKAKVYVTLQ